MTSQFVKINMKLMGNYSEIAQDTLHAFYILYLNIKTIFTNWG